MRRSMMPAMLLIAAGSLSACKARNSAPAPPPEERPTELEARLPSPTSKVGDFAVGDEVSIIDDKGSFEIDGRVSEITKAPKGYKVRVGSGRVARSYTLTAEQVFPAPWASAARVKSGDVIYEPGFLSNLPPTRCVAKEVPTDVHSNVWALCDGETRQRSIARRDMFYAFEPAAVSEVAVGEIVYFDRRYWVMVVGKSDDGGRVIVRSTGFATKDQLVTPAHLQRVR